MLGRDTRLYSLDPEIRRNVTAEPIEIADGTASVTFTVAALRRTFSLVVYHLPGGAFSFGERQYLLAATTETVDPGTHELSVDLSSAVCPPTGGYERLATLPIDEAFSPRAVALSDDADVAVIGAPDDDHAGNRTGAAYVFGRDGGTWSWQAKPVADDAAARDEFGSSVAVSGPGDVVVVGAPNDVGPVGAPGNSGDGTGAAYVFVRTDGTWNQRAKLTAEHTSGYEYEWFGGTVGVSTSGETAVVGAQGDAAYVFGRTDGAWSREARLRENTADETDDRVSFAHSVAVSGSGDTAVAGDPAHGEAYVFVRRDGAWRQQSRLVGAGTTTEAGYFGDAVALSGTGDTLVVGSTADAAFDRGPEPAYVFVRTDGNWTRQAELTPPPSSDDGFGMSAALSDSGDVAAVGTYVFGRENGKWSWRAKLPSPGATIAFSDSGDTLATGPYVFGR